MSNWWKKFKNNVKELFDESTPEPQNRQVTGIDLRKFENYVGKILLCQSQKEIKDIIEIIAPEIRTGNLSLEEVNVLHDLLKEQVLVIKSGFYEEKWIGLSYADKKELINVSRRLVPKK